MHWKKVEESTGQEKVMAWEAQPGGCGQNEMCDFIILKEGSYYKFLMRGEGH